MNIKRESLLVVVALLVSMFGLTMAFLPSNVVAVTLYVGGPGPGNFTAIQDAINISNPGDTVYVFNGTYYENVIVNQSVNLVGQDRNGTIIDGGGSGDVVRIVVDWVNISHLTVTNSGSMFANSGVFSLSSHNNISHLVSRNNSLGIYLSWVSDITVYDCQVLNNSEGVYMEWVDLSTVAYTTTVGNRDGIYPYYSSYNKFVNNDMSDTNDCIYPDRSHYNLISGNKARDCRTGIDILNSDGNTVVNNDIARNSLAGIYLDRSDKNIILNNTISDTPEGISVELSMDLTFSGNKMTGAGFLIWTDVIHEFWTSHSIDITNTVNGRPVYYWKNATGSTVPPGAGQVLLYNSTDVIVDNQNLSEATVGIHSFVSSNLRISNGTIHGNYYGAFLENAGNGSVTGIRLNNSIDVQIDDSHHMMIANNSGPNYGGGIRLDNTHNSTIAYNPKCFQLLLSDNNTVIGNTASEGRGFEVYGNANFLSQNNASTSDWRGLLVGGLLNTFVNNNFSGVELQGSHNVFSRNVISTGDAGSGTGIYISKSTGNMFEHNVITKNNNSGITISFQSNNNTFFNNTISDNGGAGLEIWDLSFDNLIYHNLFINNSQHAFSEIDSMNQWDNGYPSGGNYWDDYTGSDWLSGPLQNIISSDGIGDSPYPIPGGFDRDRYPLMSPTGPIFPRPPGPLFAELSGRGVENVTLGWFGSADDGFGFHTVVRYDIYRNSTYDASGLGYAYLGSVPNGTHEFIDTYVGEGDPSSYFYTVCAVDFNNNSTCSIYQAGKFTQSLTVGLNLLSAPVLWNVSTETVLQTVSYDKAWSYSSIDQEWRSYMKSKPFAGDLEYITHRMGVWVDVTANSNFTVAGAVPIYTYIDLKAGWNLVGYPSFSTSFTVGDLKAILPVTRVEGLDPMTSPYFLKPMQDSEILQTGQGYWVHVSQDATWTVSTS